MASERVKKVRQKPTTKSILPCKSCPWRVDSDASKIPGYDQQKAVGLLRTASLGTGDDFRPIMACHNSTDTKMHACKGYLAREGWNNLNVRVLLARGQILNPSLILGACESHSVELEPDYPAVLEKLVG